MKWVPVPRCAMLTVSITSDHGSALRVDCTFHSMALSRLCLPQPVDCSIPAKRPGWSRRGRHRPPNARRLKALLAQGCELMARCQGRGYGHGALPVARAALAGGPNSLVWPPSRREWNLRQAGIEAPLLVMANLSRNPRILKELPALAADGPTISSNAQALLLPEPGQCSAAAWPLHLKPRLRAMTRLALTARRGPAVGTVLNGLRCRAGGRACIPILGRCRTAPMMAKRPA